MGVIISAVVAAVISLVVSIINTIQIRRGNYAVVISKDRIERLTVMSAYATELVTLYSLDKLNSEQEIRKVFLKNHFLINLNPTKYDVVEDNGIKKFLTENSDEQIKEKLDELRDLFSIYIKHKRNKIKVEAGRKKTDYKDVNKTIQQIEQLRHSDK